MASALATRAIRFVHIKEPLDQQEYHLNAPINGHNTPLLMNVQPCDEYARMNSNKLAVSLALAETNICLETLHTLAP